MRHGLATMTCRMCLSSMMKPRPFVIRPIVKCQQCGAEWMLRNRNKLPRQCWECGSRRWNTVERGAVRIAPETQPNQCLRCGYTWFPYTASLRCPRCFSVYWNQERRHEAVRENASHTP